MVSPHRTSLLTALVLAFLLVSTVVPTAAAPPPRPLCDGCGDSYAETAAEFGVDIDVTESTAVVHVHENGSATWVVANHVADSAGIDRLRANASLRAAIADRAMWDTEVLSTSVSDDGVVTTRYREADFATESFGVTRSGMFTQSVGYANMEGLGADELTIVAPEGTRVGATVPGSTVADDGREMTLTSFDTEQEGEFVTFVPVDAPLGSVQSTLALWAGKLSAVADDLRWLIPVGSLS